MYPTATFDVDGIGPVKVAISGRDRADFTFEFDHPRSGARWRAYGTLSRWHGDDAWSCFLKTYGRVDSSGASRASYDLDKLFDRHAILAGWLAFIDRNPVVPILAEIFRTESLAERQRSEISHLQEAIEAKRGEIARYGDLADALRDELAQIVASAKAVE